MGYERFDQGRVEKELDGAGPGLKLAFGAVSVVGERVGVREVAGVERGEGVGGVDEVEVGAEGAKEGNGGGGSAVKGCEEDGSAEESGVGVVGSGGSGGDASGDVKGDGMSCRTRGIRRRG